ncbi:MAG: DUF3822 family protein [Bacteroidota bacterium]
MKDISFIDESFDSGITSTYQLSVQFGPRTFAYAILDTIRMKYIAFRSSWFDTPVKPENQSEHLSHLLHSVPFLLRNYKSVRLMIQNRGALLIPEPLFNPDNASDYFSVSAPPAGNERVLFSRLRSCNACLLFCIREDIRHQALALLNEVTITHQSVPFIESALKTFEIYGSADQLHVNITPDLADLVLVKSGRLILYNSYPLRSDADLAYFILNAYDEFDLSQEETPLIISGWPELYPDTKKVLPGYIRSVRLKEFDKGYLYTQKFTDVHQYSYANLINLALCG